MTQKIMTQIKLHPLAVWLHLGAALIALGFLLDGSTEIGHHAMLICGGLAIGWGAGKEITK